MDDMTFGEDHSLPEFLSLVAQTQGSDPNDPTTLEEIDAGVTSIRAMNPPGATDADILKTLVPKVSTVMADMSRLKGTVGDSIENLKTTTSPEALAAAESANAENKVFQQGSRSISDALGGAMNTSAQNERYRMRAAEDKDSTIGAFERKKTAAQENVKATTTGEQWKQTEIELKKKQQEDADSNNPDSVISKMTRVRVKAAIQKFPKLGELLGGLDPDSMTASQFAKASPIFDKMEAGAQKELELDFKKQKVESDAEIKRADQLNKLQIAQERLASQGAINSAKSEAAASKYDTERQRKDDVQADKLEKGIDKVENNAAVMRDSVKKLERLKELNASNPGGSKVSAGLRNMSAAIGGPGSELTTEWNTLAEDIRLNTGQKLKGAPTDREQEILKAAAGVGLEKDEVARGRAIELALTLAREQLNTYDQDISRVKNRIGSLRGEETPATKTIKFGDLK